MPRRDLTFEAIKLLSQRIVSNPDKIPEGGILQKTSCMNPEDAELVGLIEMMKVHVPRDSDRYKRLDALSKRFEIIGLSKWVKGELTHLGFRAGLRYQENIDVAKDGEVGVEELDEADIATGAKEE